MLCKGMKQPSVKSAASVPRPREITTTKSIDLLRFIPLGIDVTVHSKYTKKRKEKSDECISVRRLLTAGRGPLATSCILFSCIAKGHRRCIAQNDVPCE